MNPETALKLIFFGGLLIAAAVFAIQSVRESRQRKREEELSKAEKLEVLRHFEENVLNAINEIGKVSAGFRDYAGQEIKELAALRAQLEKMK